MRTMRMKRTKSNVVCIIALTELEAIKVIGKKETNLLDISM